MAITSSSSAIAPSSVGISPYLHKFMKRALLSRVVPKLLHSKDAQPNSIPKGMSNVFEARRRNRIVPASASAYQLTEGVTPSPLTPSTDEILVTVYQYGGWINATDVADQISYDNLMQADINDLGDFSGEVVDLSVRENIVTGTQVIYANGRTARANVASGDNLTDVEIKKAAAALRNLNVPAFPDGTYHAIIPSLSQYDLFGTDSWKLKGYYQQGSDIEKGKLGDLFGIRFMDTSLAKKFAAAGSGGIDVYATLVYGPDAFASVDLPGLNQDVIIKTVESGGADNPLNQRGSRGTKASMGSVILDNKKIVRIEHAIGYSGF
jgi:N4-gp56 family major capsid protein